MKLTLMIFGRSALRREELSRDLDVLRVDYPELKIDTCDMTFVSALREKVQTVLLDFEKATPGDESALSELRKNGYTGPVVILSNRGPEGGVGYMGTNVFIYDYTKGTRDLVGIVRRLVVGAVVAARKHPRHRVDEAAMIRLDGQSLEFRCRVKNMSKGGAMLECDRMLAIRPGVQLNVRFLLRAVARAHSVNARVAWTDKLLFGVEFLSGAKPF